MEHNNAITDIPGIEVGQAQDDEALTGCTVILCRRGAVGGVDVRGSAPGTRETDLLNPINLVDKVHAVVLAGGSAFGLDTASGVVKYLAEQKIGYGLGAVRVPIVPAAILFDLGLGKSARHPDAEMGYAAASDAHTGPVAEGNVGAGTGATVGKIFGMTGAMKSGLGTAGIEIGSGVMVGAIAAVNAFGDVLDPANGQIIAGARPAKLGPVKLGGAGPFADIKGDEDSCRADDIKFCHRRQHRHRSCGDQRQVRQGAGHQSGADGARRAGTHCPPGAHHAGWRYDLCPRHRA